MKPTPITRKEYFLNALGAYGAISVPSPVPRIEKYLYRLDGFNDKDIPEPVTRIEKYLYYLCGEHDKGIPEPVTRIEKYLYYACGFEEYGYPTPVTREEQFWYDYIQSYIEVKTLTGTLPLTFRTSETALRSWTIYGNNTQHNYSAQGTLPLTFTTHTAGNVDDWLIYGNAGGVGERTKNLLEIVDLSGEHSNVEWVTDKSKGTYTLNGTANANYLPWISGNITLKAGISYKLSGCVAGGSANTYMVYTYINNTYYRDLGNGVTIPAFNEDTECQIALAAYNGTVFENTVFKPMLRESTTSDTFIPFGYQIHLTISQSGQTDKTVDIYIGDSPLTEGKTISKSSTGVDFELFEGENTLDTTLFNKPSMSIEGVDYVGVGEPTNDGWQIPLTVTHYTDNIFDKDAKNTNKGYEDSTCLMWGGSLTNPYLTGNEDNNCFVSEKIPASPNTTYYLTDGIFKNTDNGIYSVFLWNRYRMSDYQAFPTEKTFTTGDDTRFIQVCVLKTYADAVMITTKPTETYIPHVEVNNVNVPIDAPLTASQSVTDALTINTFEGENVLDTTLDNKPQMSITYKGG